MNGIELKFREPIHQILIRFNLGYGPNNSNEDEQNILTMELKLIEQKLMGSTTLGSTELNKVSEL